MQFSIIIPTLNEAEGISAFLTALQPLRSAAEMIVVDGGSVDNTPMLASGLVDRVISSAAGRARQMNCGADLATGEILVFLHADTFLPENALQLIAEEISNDKPWGRFDVYLIGKPLMLKVVATLMNWRSRLTGIATGDQVIFVKREVFFCAGQYPEIALMEDITLSKTLKRIAHPICLSAKVTSSGRRWERNGVWKTIILMWWLRWRYAMGADPKTLAELYRSGKFWKP